MGVIVMTYFRRRARALPTESLRLSGGTCCSVGRLELLRRERVRARPLRWSLAACSASFVRDREGSVWIVKRSYVQRRHGQVSEAHSDWRHQWCTRTSSSGCSVTCCCVVCSCTSVSCILSLCVRGGGGQPTASCDPANLASNGHRRMSQQLLADSNSWLTLSINTPSNIELIKLDLFLSFSFL